MTVTTATALPAQTEPGTGVAPIAVHVGILATAATMGGVAARVRDSFPMTYSDGDSFVAWGEPVKAAADLTVRHLVVIVPSTAAGVTGWASQVVDPLREAGVMVDASVAVTDALDWSVGPLGADEVLTFWAF